MSVELVTSETELFSEIDPIDEQSPQILAGDSYNLWDEAEACINNLDIIVSIVPDFHIIEQIRGANVHNAKHKQVVSKKVKYTNRFGKIRKALNIALNLGCEEELINMITRFIDQKKSMTKKYQQ
ncbi:3895_t:CDS:2 [Cetraspora pellucida]|uniref:3895_t:CDS:1 n=1 Tax=Cetraspora pellucida TaxID=1433469 RepID=A0A9N9HYZ9_9GLOM|nr:3895_t:CDS:2 [Cetraspora pellucida]